MTIVAIHTRPRPRFQPLYNLLKYRQCNEIQSAIELIHISDEFCELEFKERDEFESKYFLIIAKTKAIIKDKSATTLVE